MKPMAGQGPGWSLAPLLGSGPTAITEAVQQEELGKKETEFVL